MMNDDTKKIEDFFNYDLKVKKLLNDIVPKQIDFYDNDAKVKYADKVALSLKKMELYIDRMIIGYKLPEDISMQFEKKMEEINNYVNSKDFYRLLNEGYNNTLKYIHNNVGDMRAEFVDSVQKSLIGYYGFFGKDVLNPMFIVMLLIMKIFILK